MPDPDLEEQQAPEAQAVLEEDAELDADTLLEREVQREANAILEEARQQVDLLLQAAERARSKAIEGDDSVRRGALRLIEVIEASIVSLNELLEELRRHIP